MTAGRPLKGVAIEVATEVTIEVATEVTIEVAVELIIEPTTTTINVNSIHSRRCM